MEAKSNVERRKIAGAMRPPTNMLHFILLGLTIQSLQIERNTAQVRILTIVWLSSQISVDRA